MLVGSSSSYRKMCQRKPYLLTTSQAFQMQKKTPYRTFQTSGQKKRFVYKIKQINYVAIK
jgi:hypothetical protein